MAKILLTPEAADQFSALTYLVAARRMSEPRTQRSGVSGGACGLSAYSARTLRARLGRQTLWSMMATQKDIEYLLPKYAEKLWPRIEPEMEQWAKNVDAFAKEWTQGRELKSLVAENIRNDKGALPEVKKLIEMIPKNVSIYRLNVDYQGGGGDRKSFFFYIRGRWMWIPPLNVAPAALESVK